MLVKNTHNLRLYLNSIIETQHLTNKHIEKIKFSIFSFLKSFTLKIYYQLQEFEEICKNSSNLQEILKVEKIKLFDDVSFDSDINRCALSSYLSCFMLVDDFAGLLFAKKVRSSIQFRISFTPSPNLIISEIVQIYDDKNKSVNKVIFAR